MAATDARLMSASLALVQSAGATALELPMPTDAPMTVDSGCLGSPLAMSPWGTSTEACMSPWSPATPAVMPSTMSSFTFKPSQAARSPAAVASPFFPGPTLPEAHAQTFPVKPFSLGGFAPSSPAGFAPVAMSPTTQIRQNAASFGIPLNASYGEIGAPLPVRTQAGVVAPSPTTRGAPPAMPPMPGVGVPGAPGSVQFIRSMATPLTASHPRRAAGGA